MEYIEEALEGSLRAGKSKGGRKGVVLTLNLPERSVYILQRTLEDMAAQSTDFFKVRVMVLLSEDVRRAVAKAQQDEEERAAEVNYKFGTGGHPEEE